LLAALVPLSLWVLLLSLPLWTGAFLASPSSDQYGTGWAFRHWAAEQWKALGHVPLWNPEIFGGMPFVAAMHGDIFYPTAWLRLVLPTTLAMNLGFAVHYVLAGLFVYLLLRLLRVTWTGAVVGGLAYQLTGVVGSYVSPGHDGKLFVTALFPLALIGLVLAFQRRRPEGFGLLALAVGLGLLSPHPQMLYYMLVAAGLFTLYLAFGERAVVPRSRIVPLLGAALLAVVAGFGIGLIQILPFFEYIPFSPRAETYRGFEDATSYAIPWSHVPELFLSRFAGSSPEGTYWGSNFAKLHSEYLGLPVVALGLLGAASRERRRIVLWLSAISLLFLLVALGAGTPFYRLWYDVMPFMKQVRAPGMALYLVAFVIAVFAAFGVERLERGEGKDWPRWSIIAGGVVAVLALAGVFGAIAQSLAQGIELAQGRAVTAAAARAQGAIRLGAASCGIALLLTGALARALARGRLPAASLALVLVVSGDLAWNARPFWRFTRDYEALHRPDPVTERILSGALPYRVLDLDVYPGATLMALGIPQLLGHHGNELHRFDELLGGKNVWSHALSIPIWDLYAVEYVLLPAGRIDSIPGYDRVVAGAVTAAGHVADLYGRRSPTPYARLVRAAIKVPDDQAIPALARGRVPLDRLVLLPPDEAHLPDSVTAMPEPLGAEVHFESWEPGRMDIRIAGGAPVPAYLVVSENWYKDWRAVINGEPGQVLRGTVSLLVVPLPAGAQRVSLRFQSDAYRRGKLLTWLSVVVVAGALIVPPALRRRRGG
jgi:hypothetical protein